MKVVCCSMVVIETGHICPLCGRLAAVTLPLAAELTRPVICRATLPTGHRVQPGFRFRPEHDAEAAGIAEQNGRKALKNDGTFRIRPGKKRRAMPGPNGRKARRGIVRVPAA